MENTFIEHFIRGFFIKNLPYKMLVKKIYHRNKSNGKIFVKILKTPQKNLGLKMLVKNIQFSIGKNPGLKMLAILSYFPQENLGLKMFEKIFKLISKYTLHLISSMYT